MSFIPANTWGGFVAELAHEVTIKVISRHFLYLSYYRRFQLDKNDHKCQPCEIRRRFKIAPEKLVAVIKRRLIAELETLEEEFKITFKTASALQKGGVVYTQLEQQGRYAIHKWIDSETCLGECLRRETRGQGFAVDDILKLPLSVKRTLFSSSSSSNSPSENEEETREQERGGIDEVDCNIFVSRGVEK